MRGALVVFEGAEGVGKTTQMHRLAATLARAGQSYTSLREPGGTAVGEAIRGVLLDPALRPAAATEALLFLASRAQIVSDSIRPALARGEVVLLDRFFLSTYAYQIAGRGLDADRVTAANALAVGGLVPDVTLVLEMPVERGLARAAERGAHDRMELADAEFHERVGGAFTLFGGAEWQAAHPECGPIVAIDANGSEEDVSARVVAAIAQHVEWLGEALDRTNQEAAP